jgi:predicted phosphodiesterase
MNARRVAALYDIHANLPALDAVLRDVRQAGVERIVLGGDVLPGPMPAETLARLSRLDLPAQCILGNGDRVVLWQRAGKEIREVPVPFREHVRWNAQRLRPEHETWMTGWPATCRLTIRGLGEVLFCHATPWNDTDSFTRQTPEHHLAPLFAGVGVPLVVCGHTHMQFDRTIGGVRVVNAGSVGMPFSQPQGAYWLLLGPDVQLRRTAYDFTATAARMRETGCPQVEELSVRYVLEPPTEAESLARLARAWE